MSETDRRTFIKALGATAAAAALPASIARAMAIPANNATGTINDVEHIVFLMQENRSFDSYLGTLRGVRGYGDPRGVTLPSGKPVWYQPTGTGTDYVLPFHPTAPDLGLTFLEDLAHDWTSTHAAWNNGAWDQWVPNKGSTTMAYYTRHDIPYQYALADAFTVCDAYHCSLMGPTDPNRYHMWTGWVGNDGAGGGPVIDNAEAGYNWSTYPERLQKAGITWKIYQDVGTGLNAANYWGWTSDPYIGNYGDNSLLYFFHYQHAAPGTPLANNAKTGTNISVFGTLFDEFADDVMNDALPRVSWIVAPEAYTEHPNWPPNYGAWYVSRMLDALTANPKVWAKTVLFLTYDENDGFFDHMVAPTPPRSAAEGVSTVSTVNEIFPGDSEYPAGPYGLGVRVPMIVISPWSKGGFVNSEVFDHTSLIRFIEQRFAGTPGIIERNITPWRRAVTGDLTSTFNFKTPNALPVTLPPTVRYQPPNTTGRYPDYVPTVPASQHLPPQEPGTRFARALPYQPLVLGSADPASGQVTIRFGNAGAAGTPAIVYQVRSLQVAGGPWTYTIQPHRTATGAWTVTGGATSLYDLSVYGPNGFLRAYKGSILGGHANLTVATTYDTANNGIGLTVTNAGPTADVTITDGYTGAVSGQTLPSGASFTTYYALEAMYGWYDLTVTAPADPTFSVQVAGHVETGKDSLSDPMIGGLGAAP
jgi:phospholipase C